LHFSIAAVTATITENHFGQARFRVFEGHVQILKVALNLKKKIKNQF
jgi:hypothetical protein